MEPHFLQIGSFLFIWRMNRIFGRICRSSSHFLGMFMVTHCKGLGIWFEVYLHGCTLHCRKVLPFFKVIMRFQDVWKLSYEELSTEGLAYAGVRAARQFHLVTISISILGLNPLYTNIIHRSHRILIAYIEFYSKLVICLKFYL